MITISADKIKTIQSKIPNLDLSFYLSTDFSSAAENYRENIRNELASKHSFRFNRQQLANLSDLNQLPTASDGFFSISHCPSLGGYSFSNLKHGFDLENMDRISKPVILRTCSADEVAKCPNAKLLWVAKEAALKAFSKSRNEFVITDFQTENWKSHSENDIFSYRVTSNKTLDFGLNKGVVFSEKDILFGIFFQ